MNRIFVNPEHQIGQIDRNIFGGFAEHLERCIYGGIYDPDSSLADDRGLRTDVMEAMRRLNMPVILIPLLVMQLKRSQLTGQVQA